MSRGVSKELEWEIRFVLTELVNGRLGAMEYTLANTEPLRRDAINYLADIDALRDEGVGNYRLTAYGREYWEKLTSPRWHWFRRSWFPASVAAGTILFSGVSAAVNIANLVA